MRFSMENIHLSQRSYSKIFRHTSVRALESLLQRIIGHASTMIIVHTYTMIIVHLCIMVKVCTMVTVLACTMVIKHAVLWTQYMRVLWCASVVGIVCFLLNIKIYIKHSLFSWGDGRLDAWTLGRLSAWTLERLNAWTFERLNAWTLERVNALNVWTCLDTRKLLKIFCSVHYFTAVWLSSYDMSDVGQVADKNDVGNVSDKSDTGKVADKKSSPQTICADKKSTEDKHVPPHIPQRKQEKRRKHNKATHVKKTINKPRTSNQLKKMFDPKRGPRRDSEETSSSYYTSSNDS